MGRQNNPTVSLRAIAAALRRYRAASEATLEEAAAGVDYHAASLSRAEQAKGAPHPAIVRALLEFYGENDATVVENYVSLAKHGRRRGWWNQYRDLVSTAYIGLEGAATRICRLEIQLIPGLLQTDAYTLALINAEADNISADEIDRRLALRNERKKVLNFNDDPCELWAVFDEAVLHRPIGDPKTMGDQLDHLLEMSALRNICIQILPFSSGVHGSHNARFTILKFDDPTDPGVVFLEQMHWKDEFVEEPAQISRFADAFVKLQAAAEPPKRSLAMIKSARDTFRNP